jgi:autotransporter-associated beta strand protein
MLRAAIAAPLLFSAARADYQSEILSENPLVYYRFSDGVTTGDIAPPAANIGSLGAVGNGPFSTTVVNDVAGAIPGSGDTALQTNGAAVSVPFNAALNNQGSFSVEAWLNPASIPATGGLLCPISSWLQDGGGNREGWLIYHGDAATGFNFRTYNRNGLAVAASINSGPGVTAGQWYHVVATWDDSAAIARIYVNGVLKAFSPTIAPGGGNSRPYDANTTNPFTMGARSDGGFGWTGNIDEPAYYNAILSDAQVLAHYNNGISPTPSPSYDTVVLGNAPVGYWRLNEDVFVPRTPPTADNLGTLGAGADGGYIAGAKNSASGPSPASGFGGFGANNSCLTLPDANGFVTANQSLLNGRPAFTVMGWVKRGATHTTRGGYFGQNDLLEFGDAGNDLNVEAWVNAAGGNIVQPHGMVDDQWTFICLTGDGTSNRLFVNGTQVGDLNVAVADYGSSTFNFNIGGGGIFNTAGDFFRGDIDEVAIFGHAVTPGRVQQLYAAALSNAGPGLVDSFPSVTPSGAIPEGGSYTVAIDATGSPPFTYQWKLNGDDIPGATATTYTVTDAEANTPPSAPYSYSVVVTNGLGTVSSDVTDVYVTPALKWTGSDPTNPGDWDIGGSQNWKTFTGGVASTYSDEYAAVFDDSATLKTVEVTQDVLPATIVFDNDTDYTITGADWLIAGVDGSVFSKRGTGTVEIGNYGVSVGSMLVSEGTLRVGNGSSGNVAPITPVSMLGGQLQLNLAPDALYESPTVMSTGSSLSVTGSGNLEITAPITGAQVSEVFSRAGTVVVRAANSAGKTVAINAGTVAFDGSQVSNRLAYNAAVTVNAGATMEVRGVNSIPGGPVNSVDVTLNSSTLGIVSGESVGTGTGGQSHAHLRHLTLNQSQIILSYSGGGSAYNGESFQLNGNLTVTGSAASTIGNGVGADQGNSGLALLAVNPSPVAPAVHTFHVADVVAGIAPDLIIATELENTDAAAADSAASSILKTGTGTLRLADGISHSYTGTLNVSAGTLEATGSLAGPLTLGAGTSFRPGTSAGTFTAGATTLAGTYYCEIDGAVSDKLLVNGDITVQAGAQIAFTVLGGGATAPFYEVCKCSGNLIGSLPGVSGLPAGYTLTVISNSSIVLVKNGVTFSTSIAGLATTPGGTEDFSSSGGGFAIAAPISPETDWIYSAGSWRSNGQANGFGTDNTSNLASPVYVVTQSGPVTLTFSHRHSFEQGLYDGGAVDVSVNGGAFTRVPLASFSQNEYNGTVLANSGTTLQGQAAFVENSAGHPSFITSVCALGTFAAGDRVQVRFVSSSDNNTSGNLTPQGWEVDSVTVSGSRANLMTLSWPVGQMEYSDNLQPPWTAVPGTSPLVIDGNAVPRRFYRIRP